MTTQKIYDTLAEAYRIYSELCGTNVPSISRDELYDEIGPGPYTLKTISDLWERTDGPDANPKVE